MEIFSSPPLQDVLIKRLHQKILVMDEKEMRLKPASSHTKATHRQRQMRKSLFLDSRFMDLWRFDEELWMKFICENFQLCKLIFTIGTKKKSHRAAMKRFRSRCVDQASASFESGSRVRAISGPAASGFVCFTISRSRQETGISSR